ncbi:MAG: glycosyltransferase [Cyanobacteria bacterium J06632_22]
MRQLYFLVPGTGKPFQYGGLFAELNLLNIARKLAYTAQLVTYTVREDKTLFLPDLLQSSDDHRNAIFVITWGYDVPKLIQQLQHCHVIYHAQSSGYAFDIPSHVPILTGSRNTLGYWGQRSPHALLYYLPNLVPAKFKDLGLVRTIDILIHQRKSSQYLTDCLIPALQQQFNVFVIDRFIDDLVTLLNQSKLYLYDSTEYWSQKNVTEGFGLQPLEALACGCQVFSSVNGGLSDYLDPGFNCHKIAGYSQAYDIQRITDVLNQFEQYQLPPVAFDEYRHDNIAKRLQIIMTELNQFFDHRQNTPNAKLPFTAKEPAPTLQKRIYRSRRWLKAQIKQKFGR